MIKVNEIFGPTIQGEGKSAGKPVMFLRLSQCNLHCIWCDTPHTWNWTGTPFAHPEKFDRETEEHEMEPLAVFQKLQKDCKEKALVISGGEPFLQQRQLMPLLRLLNADGWWVEVETNGTIPVREEFVALVNQINCSPKLANSLDPARMRIRPNALANLATEPKVNFKFVIATPLDLLEVENLVAFYKFKEVRLMPECRTKEELHEKEPWLRKVAAENNFIFCTRLSIEMSGTKRGV